MEWKTFKIQIVLEILLLAVYTSWKRSLPMLKKWNHTMIRNLCHRLRSKPKIKGNVAVHRRQLSETK